MGFRLTNQKHPGLALHMTNGAWFDILNLAEDHGWNPLGTFTDEMMVGLVSGISEISLNGADIWADSYSEDDGAQVLLDDALNLADALERAFIESDPKPSLDYLPGSENGWRQTNGSMRAGIGVILAVRDFCYRGAFRFERL